MLSQNARSRNKAGSRPRLCFTLLWPRLGSSAAAAQRATHTFQVVVRSSSGGRSRSCQGPCVFRGGRRRKTRVIGSQLPSSPLSGLLRSTARRRDQDIFGLRAAEKKEHSQLFGAGLMTEWRDPDLTAENWRALADRMRARLCFVVRWENA